MTEASPIVRALVRDALEHDGRVPIARLAQEAVSIDVLRDLARRHSLNPKGYRIEKASAAKLVPLLVDPRRPDVVEELVTALVERLVAAPSAAAPTSAEPSPQLAEFEARLAIREREVEGLRADLARCRAQATRHREREAEFVSRLDAADTRLAASRAEIESLRRELAARPVENGDATDARIRIHDLERLREGLEAEIERQRRMIAERQAQNRELEQQVTELRELVPVGKRRKAERPPAPVLAERFRLPYFTPGFYKSLVGRERRHVEQSVQAVLLFCTEGPTYPGLEVKQIEGQELWSLRASLKLRVYFEIRDDGDVDVIAVADREDQHTTLRRLKER